MLGGFTAGPAKVVLVFCATIDSIDAKSRKTAHLVLCRTSKHSAVGPKFRGLEICCVQRITYLALLDFHGALSGAVFSYGIGTFAKPDA